ncbi:hypothetical protein [Streptomyces sp. SJL17-4]|uniref:hypothetical protein n=1 Tax=Streptomyces sp. SJL17-4 TaxID=2967224 RepID=UPI0030CF52F6
MSYDLAVWEGSKPADDVIAGEVLTQLYDRYIDTEEEFPPSPRIAEYVAGLLARWVDLTEDEEGTSPWSTGPLIGEAAGPLLPNAVQHGRGSVGLRCGPRGIDGACLLRSAASAAEAVTASARKRV